MLNTGESPDKSTGSTNYSLTYFAVAAGDETLQFLQQLSALTRCDVDDWSLMLPTDKPRPSPEIPGTRSCVELHQCFLAYLQYLFYSRLQTASTHRAQLFWRICFHAINPFEKIACQMRHRWLTLTHSDKFFSPCTIPAIFVTVNSERK